MMSNNELMKTENTEVMKNATAIKPSRDERTVSPRVAVYENADAVVLELEMPGVARDAIDVWAENDELTVYGKRTSPEEKGLELVHRERLPFSYYKTFVLSDTLESGNISAEYKDGVLTLTLPKAAEAKPRKIAVN